MLVWSMSFPWICSNCRSHGKESTSSSDLQLTMLTLFRCPRKVCLRECLHHNQIVQFKLYISSLILSQMFRISKSYIYIYTIWNETVFNKNHMNSSCFPYDLSPSDPPKSCWWNSTGFLPWLYSIWITSGSSWLIQYSAAFRITTKGP